MASIRLDLSLPLRAFDLELALDAGPETVALVGPSGAGKTSVLRAIAGLARPARGTISCGDEIWFNADRRIDRRPEERSVGFVFQEYALFPHLNVEQNVTFGGARADRLLWRLHIEHLAKAKPSELSGGERQRVAIGRALVREPNAYLMDEPISALDARLREEMRVELNRLQRQLKHTFVHVTHDQEEAMAVADRLCIMKGGRIAQIGTPLDVYNAPVDRYVARQLGSPPMNFISGHLDGTNGRFTAENMPLAAAAPAAAGGNGPAWLGIRPEDLAIAHEPARTGTASVPAAIYEIEPLGAMTIVDVKASDHILKAQLPGQPRFSQGEAVQLVFDLAKCHLFDGSSERRLTTGLTV